MTEKNCRRILKLILTLALLVNAVMVVRQQFLYRDIVSDSAEAAGIVGLPEQDAPVTPPALPAVIENGPPLRPAKWAGAMPEEVMALMGLNLGALEEVNADVAGWIEIPGTELSYPLVQGADDYFYLSHNWKGESSGGGSVYLASANSRDLSDFHTIAYAHRMRNGTMFGTLKYYKSLDYWREHPSVYLVLDSGVYRYDVFSAFAASVESLIYQPDLAGREDAFIQFCLENSEIETGIVPYGEDHILTLSTCTGTGHSKRWVVQGVLVQVYARDAL